MSSDGHIRGSKLPRRRGRLVAVPPPQPIPDVVEKCEQLLERARSGEIRGIGIAAVILNSEVTTAFIGGDDLRSVGLAAHLLVDRIMAEYR